MGIENIIIGTGILWLLGAVIVQPIVNKLVEEKLQENPEYAPLLEADAGTVELTETQQEEVGSLASNYFMAVDSAVLGIAGFLIGLFTGFFFIGIAFEGKHWPGMIAFIVASLIGSSIYAG